MLIYFMTIWNVSGPFGILCIWPIGIVCCNLVYFSHFGMFGQRNIWQPCWKPVTEVNPERFFSFALEAWCCGHCLRPKFT
jgi:hypothetical protein